MHPRILEFDLDGMVCDSCVNTIKNAVDGIKNPAICIKSKTVTFHDPKRSDCITLEIKSELEDQEVYDIISEVIAGVGFDSSNPKVILSHEPWYKAALGIAAGIGMMIPMLIPHVTLTFTAMLIMGAVSTAISAYLGKETFKQAFSAKLTMSSLFTLSTIVALGTSIVHLFFFRSLPMMFDVPLFILGSMHLGIGIKKSAQQKVMKGLSFRQRAPDTVLRKKMDSEIFEEAKVSELKPGDIIKVLRGKIIPVDGKCRDESSRVNTTIIDGMLGYHEVKKDQELKAGAIVSSEIEYLTVFVDQKFEDSNLYKLDKQIEAGRKKKEKAPLESSAHRMLKWLVPSVIALSAIAFGIHIAVPALAIKCAVSVLVSACPCTFGFITEWAIKIGLSKAEEQGVIFKDGKRLQAAQEVDTVIFDWNGTLTKGMPKVLECTVPNSMLSLLKALEKDSQNLKAQAVQKYITTPVQELKNIQTFRTGRRVKINDDTYTVGNAEFVGIEDTNKDMIYFAKNGVVVGYLLLEDELRDDIKNTIQKLKKMGKRVEILSGDDSAHIVAQLERHQIKVDKVTGKCDDKVAYIEGLNGTQKVAMIGDGGNDAAAIAHSHFSVALQSPGSDVLTQKNAGAYINSDSLSPIVSAFEVANQTVSNVTQNFGISLTYNAVAIALFGGFLMCFGVPLPPPALGAFIMLGQTFFVFLNAQRFKNQAAPSPSKQSAIPVWQSTDRQLQSLPSPKPSPRVPAMSLGAACDSKILPCVSTPKFSSTSTGIRRILKVHEPNSNEESPDEGDPEIPSGFLAKFCGLFALCCSVEADSPRARQYRYSGSSDED